MANIGGRDIQSPTPGITVTLTIDIAVQNTIARWTAGQATTVNVSGTPSDGAEMMLIITNDGVLARLITLGSGFLGAGTMLGILNKKSVITFVADGGTYIECSRTIGM